MFVVGEEICKEYFVGFVRSFIDVENPVLFSISVFVKFGVGVVKEDGFSVCCARICVVCCCLTKGCAVFKCPSIFGKTVSQVFPTSVLFFSTPFVGFIDEEKVFGTKGTYVHAVLSVV